jgi:signal transduction histidine kinase
MRSHAHRSTIGRLRTPARVWALLARWAPPVVLGGLALFEVWVTPFLESRAYQGPAAAYTVGAVAMIAGLAVRTRAPGLGLAAVLANVVIEFAYAPGGLADSSAEAFVAMLVAFYSVGAYCELRGAAIRLAAALPVLLGLQVTEIVRGDSTVVEAAGAYPFVLGSWGAGVAVRHMRARASTLEGRVDDLARQRDSRAREAVADERARIARELHDVVTHSVTTMVLQAAGARQVVRSHPDEAEAALRSAETTGRQALRELRRLLGILRTDEESSPAPQPGLREIEPLVERMRNTGLAVSLHVEGAPPIHEPGVDLAAYRIVQEALTNARKHAGPVEATVAIRYAPHAIELEVRNAGSAAAHAVNGRAPGHGLIGMRERAALYGGTLRASPGADGGFTVLARLPFEGDRP